MLCTYVKCYKEDGTFTGYEHLYPENSHANALARCRKENPEFEHCNLVAQTYDTEDPKNRAHFQALLINQR